VGAAKLDGQGKELWGMFFLLRCLLESFVNSQGPFYEYFMAV